MFRKVIISGMIAAVLSFGASFANAGIIILQKDSTKTSSTTTTSTMTTSSTDSGDPCTDDSTLTAAIGIIILQATGVSVGGSASTCGIIILQ